jgi:3-oxoadipate CoA-transferase beta subunit
MIRGGHIDICVLGRVPGCRPMATSPTGIPASGRDSAVGGAMDLAAGAKQVFVTMEHLTKKGESKIVERCSYPLTGVRCVTRVYTDLAVIDIRPDGLHLVEICAEGFSFEEFKS